MVAIKQRVSRFENRIDVSLESFLFHHRVLGFLLIFVGMPLFALAAVCLCTMCVALPVAAVFGWMRPLRPKGAAPFYGSGDFVV